VRARKEGLINRQDSRFRWAKAHRLRQGQEARSQSVSLRQCLVYECKGRDLLPVCSTVADRVGLRTVDACEPRQVRKEAAAAGYARVAVLSGSVSSLFVIIQLTCFLSASCIRNAHV